MWSYWKVGLLTVLIVVMAFTTYLGGPLYFRDELESVSGTLGAAAIAVLPVLVASVCAFSLWRTHPWSLGRWGVAMGLLAMALISAMSTVTIMQILTTWPSADGEIYVAGVSAGAVSTLSYVLLAYRRVAARAKAKAL